MLHRAITLESHVPLCDASTMPGSLLVVPTAIPWERLKDRELEECLYWLIDAIGGKDLQWRLGGRGKGAPDQGRDLEAHFYTSDPDGTMVRQKWWIEAKGRAVSAKGRGTTVERAAVIEHVHLAAGRSDVDSLVIATNTTFSNPTRDWVREWQASHPRPTVRLWDRYELERLLCPHPAVVVRFCDEALSRQGQLEVVQSRFWNYASYAGKPSLRLLWNDQDDLAWEPGARLAVIVSEAANGSFSRRPWASAVGDDDLTQLLAFGLLNVLAFTDRAESSGTEQSPYFKGLAYLLLAALDRSEDVKTISDLLAHVWDQADWGSGFPDPARQYVLKPMLDLLHAELLDVCADDCSRVSMDPLELTREQIAQYWRRLAPRSAAVNDEEEEGRSSLILERTSPCPIGFEVDIKRRCPILACDSESFTLPRLHGTLYTWKHIIRARRP